MKKMVISFLIFLFFLKGASGWCYTDISCDDCEKCVIPEGKIRGTCESISCPAGAGCTDIYCGVCKKYYVHCNVGDGHCTAHMCDKGDNLVCDNDCSAGSIPCCEGSSDCDPGQTCSDCRCTGGTDTTTTTHGSVTTTTPTCVCTPGDCRSHDGNCETCNSNCLGYSLEDDCGTGEHCAVTCLL